MKKLFGLLLCLVMLITSLGIFTGCSSDDEGDFVLTICYDNGGYGLTWLENAVEKFCAKEGISKDKVYIEAQKGITDNLNDRFSSEIKIRDVVMSGSATVREWASKNYLEPINDVLNSTLSTGKTVKNSLTDQLKLEGGHYKNNYYAFPADGGAWGIYYNKTLFEEKGWEVPATVEDLMTLCETIVNDADNKDASDGNDIVPFGSCSEIMTYWNFMIMNWTVQILGEDGFKEYCKMESVQNFNPTGTYAQAKQKALQTWYDLVNAKGGAYVDFASTTYMAVQSKFAKGNIAMMPNGNWIENEIKDYLTTYNTKVALMPTPAIEGAKTDASGNVIKVSYSGVADGWIIPKKATHKDLAKKFLVFMAEPQQLRDYFVDCGGILPYECDYSSVDNSNLSACRKSVLDTVTAEEAYCFHFVSSNPMTYASARIGFWALGEPYNKMLRTNSPMSPAAIIQEEWSYLYTQGEWENIKQRANI